EQVVADPLGLYLPIMIAEGNGAIVTDVDGNGFVDFTGGVGCLNVGHAHPRVVAAVQEQAARFFHTDFTIVPYEIYVEYAERLTAVAPFSGPVKAAFFNAGTEAVERALSTQVAAETVAAIVVEPIQGEGGFIPAPPEFLQGLRALCDREGILLVVDEVQTGFGRTGRMWAVEHYGIEPDLLTVAKSMAAGLPLSGVVGKAEIMDSLWDNAVGG